MTEDLQETEKVTRTPGELVALVEALIFVSDEPLTVKLLAEVLDEDRESVQAAVEELKSEYEAPKTQRLFLRAVCTAASLESLSDARRSR